MKIPPAAQTTSYWNCKVSISYNGSHLKDSRLYFGRAMGDAFHRMHCSHSNDTYIPSALSDVGICHTPLPNFAWDKQQGYVYHLLTFFSRGI